MTVKDCGFHGSFGIGTNDHDQGNSRNLVEDVWIWASGERLIASNYRSRREVDKRRSGSDSTRGDAHQSCGGLY